MRIYPLKMAILDVQLYLERYDFLQTEQQALAPFITRHIVQPFIFLHTDDFEI